jgi:hypothetical protein
MIVPDVRASEVSLATKIWRRGCCGSFMAEKAQNSRRLKVRTTHVQPRRGNPLPHTPYEGHFRRRATVSGEYQGTSGETLLVMQPGKNWPQ